MSSTPYSASISPPTLSCRKSWTKSGYVQIYQCLRPFLNLNHQSFDCHPDIRYGLQCNGLTVRRQGLERRRVQAWCTQPVVTGLGFQGQSPMKGLGQIPQKPDIHSQSALTNAPHPDPNSKTLYFYKSQDPLYSRGKVRIRNMPTRGYPTALGSKILGHRVPLSPMVATVAANARAAGHYCKNWRTVCQRRAMQMVRCLLCWCMKVHAEHEHLAAGMLEANTNLNRITRRKFTNNV